MTTNDPTPAEAIAQRQAEFNMQAPLVGPTTAEDAYRAAPPSEARDLEAPARSPELPMRKTPQQLFGAAIFAAVSLAFVYMILQGRVWELRANLPIVVPLGSLALIYSGGMLLPRNVAAAILGMDGSQGEKMLRFRRRYALIIPKGGGDAVFEPLPKDKHAFVPKLKPKGIYVTDGGASIRITRWVAPGTIVLVYNQSNPEPVNRQGIAGFTAEHLDNMVGGLTQEWVSGQWSRIMGFTGVNKKRLLLFVVAIVVGYFLLRQYQGNFGGGLFGLFGGLF